MSRSSPVRGQVPNFADLNEEARFWGAHDTTEFEDEWESVDLEIARPLMHRLSVRLDGSHFHRLVAIAKRRGLPPSVLAAELLRETIERSEPAE